MSLLLQDKKQQQKKTLVRIVQRYLLERTQVKKGRPVLGSHHLFSVSSLLLPEVEQRNAQISLEKENTERHRCLENPTLHSAPPKAVAETFLQDQLPEKQKGERRRRSG